MSDLIPTTEVAADQRPLIEVFRENDSKSFQDAPDVATARANYEKSSAANGLTPDEVLSVRDVAVGSDDSRFHVRVYDNRSSKQPSDGVIVFFHGGGWVIGSLDTHDPVCRRLATLTGLPVVAVDYRLGPEHRFPVGHEDCVRAIEWIRDTAAENGWDANRIATIGDSAGGGLANVIAFEPRMLVDGTTVKCQVPLYPMLNVNSESPGWEQIADGFPLSAKTLRWFIDNYIEGGCGGDGGSLPEHGARGELAKDYRVSPLLLAREAAAGRADKQLLKQPPMLIQSLGLDPLGHEAVEYAALLAQGGTHVELVHWPHHAHGLYTSAGKVASGEAFLERSAEFIKRFI